MLTTKKKCVCALESISLILLLLYSKYYFLIVITRPFYISLTLDHKIFINWGTSRRTVVLQYDFLLNQFKLSSLTIYAKFSILYLCIHYLRVTNSSWYRYILFIFYFFKAMKLKIFVFHTFCEFFFHVYQTS